MLSLIVFLIAAAACCAFVLELEEFASGRLDLRSMFAGREGIIMGTWLTVLGVFFFLGLLTHPAGPPLVLATFAIHLVATDAGRRPLETRYKRTDDRITNRLSDWVNQIWK